jgi:prepilin-type N-terminal cleavage/methylation domain-containing protein
MREFFLSRQMNKGFTLIEAIVGIALLAIVFTGIFGSYRLALKVVGLSKNKITATAIANEQIEMIRNLPYASIGINSTPPVTLPQAVGVLSPSTVKTLDGVTFVVQTKVNFVTDPLQIDGTVTDTTCDLNYKVAWVTISWEDIFPGSVTLSTLASPESIVEENQACQSQPAGVLSVTVFDSHGIMVPSPLVSIYDITGTTLYDTATPTSGTFPFPLAAGTYRVVITKNGYSSARSYGSNEIATPNTPNPTVIVGNNTPVSFSIDQASTVAVNVISPAGQGNFADSFADQSEISALSGAQVASGGSSVTLDGPPYSSGFAVSKPIAPPDLLSWDSFTFSDSRPSSTNISYQILYSTDGISWNLVPDQDLIGNDAGFTVSPVDLSVLDKNIYPQLEIKGALASTDPSMTPSILNWQVIWMTNSGVAIPGASFHMQGNKTLGKDSSGNSVYKYAHDYTTDVAGQLNLPGTEGDNYNFSPLATSTLTLVGINPSPQPVSVSPGSTVAVTLYMKAANALLVTAQDDQNLSPLFSATVELKNSSGYDKIQYTNQSGQTYFAPLASGSYILSVQASGYDSYSGSVSFPGDNTILVNLHQIQ